jgi:putative PIN family toxin of toxin-antitoxin system
VSLLVRGTLGYQAYIDAKYGRGNTLSLSEDATPETRVFVRSGWDFTLVVSDELIAEWQRIRSRGHFGGRLNDHRGDAVDELLRDPATVHVRLRNVPRVCRDPADDYLIATAIAGDARFVVSSDKDLLAIGEHAGVRMLSAAEFLAWRDASPRRRVQPRW